MAKPVILAVDDDPSTLSVMERMLADYVVSTARDATEALAILSAPDHVDLLITDYHMPGMTGEELTHHARATRVRRRPGNRGSLTRRVLTR